MALLPADPGLLPQADAELRLPASELDTLCISLICNGFSFNQMKHLRGVCRKWKMAIDSDPRFRNCVGLFDQGWTKDVITMNYDACYPFRGLHFRGFPFKPNPTFKMFIKSTNMLENLTFIKLEYVKLPCQEVVHLLNRCPNLEEVFFNRCKFQLVCYHTKMIEERFRNRMIRKNYSRNTCCLHREGLVNLNLDPTTKIPPRIHTINLQHSDLFPLCLLDLLFERAEGVITEFNMEYSMIQHRKRPYFAPAKEDMDARIVPFLIRNSGTLRRLSFFRIRRGHVILQELTRLQARFTLEKLTLGESYCYEERHQYIDFYAFINQCTDAEQLQTLKLRLWHKTDGRQLLQILAQRVNLVSLNLDLHFSLTIIEDNEARLSILDVNALVGQLPKLKELCLWDRRIQRCPAMTSNYLPVLPASLSKLAFHCIQMPLVDIENYLADPPARFLTHLSCDMVPKFTDEMMQTIIEHLPLLQVLGINCAPRLTDAGLTGLPLETCKRIVQGNSSIVYRHGINPEAYVGRSLSELKNLRRLSFYFCPRVSDLSIFLAFKFPDLEEIDLSSCGGVSDVGLSFLGRNNPFLERVMLLKNHSITHFGIQNFIMENPFIHRIYTSRRCCNRKMDKQLQYVEDPRFSRIVRIHPKIYRRPHNYRMY